MNGHWKKIAQTSRLIRYTACLGCLSSAVLLPLSSRGDTNETDASTLKKLSLEELMTQDVTLVSRTPEKLSVSPSAVQVVTGEDIRRSGATSIPEALRLLPNLQVAQVDSRQWAIDARGFNNTLANKLLVMIDGRTVYTPLFAGVFWDVQQTLLEDIDRIEVVSGPGAALWGANAVNGVINIVTKSARDTQGALVQGGGGTQLQDFGAIRYGGGNGTNFFYRVYGQRFDRNSTVMPNGDDATNSWNITQGGFRTDWYAEGNNTVTFQGDGYSGNVDQSTPRPLTVDGQNLLGRWAHQFTEESELTVQTYFDRTWRKIPGQYQEDLKTYDFDLQHRFTWTERQTITWGGGYRFMQDKVGNSAGLSFVPAEKNLQLFSAFLQDEIQLAPDRLKLTLGSKVEHNDYSGFEFEPSGRIAWTIDPQNTVWSAVSRAVRSPSRIDTEFRVPENPPYSIVGSDDFKSEEVVSCELGYRVQPHKRTMFSIATFYNFYDNIRSLEPVTTNTYSIQNKNRAESWGVELSGMYQVSQWWRLRGGYTFLETHVTRKEGGLDLNRGRAEGNDPQNQIVIQSMTDLPYRLQFDLVGRYIDTLNSPDVPSYFTFDARLAWWATSNLELSVTGQNLWDNQHPEFGAAATRQEIPRSVYGKVTWRF